MPMCKIFSDDDPVLLENRINAWLNDWREGDIEVYDTNISCTHNNIVALFWYDISDDFKV